MQNRRQFIRSGLGTTAALSIGGLVATSGRVLADVVPASPAGLSTGIPGMPPIEHPGLYTIVGRPKTRKSRVLHQIGRTFSREHPGEKMGIFTEGEEIENILTSLRSRSYKLWFVDLPRFVTGNDVRAWQEASDGVAKISNEANKNKQFVFMTLQISRRYAGDGPWGRLPYPNAYMPIDVMLGSNIVWHIHRDDNGYRLDTVTNRHAKPGDPVSFDLSFLEPKA